MSDTKRWFSTGSGRIEFELELDDAKTGHHQGQCDADIADLRQLPHIKAILDKLEPRTVAAELKGYGAWSDEDLADHDANLSRLLWIACGDIVEEHFLETAKERES